jgi:hypothetical protein
VLLKKGKAVTHMKSFVITLTLVLLAVSAFAQGKLPVIKSNSSLVSIAFYRDKANIAEMKSWLDKNFPNSNNYDTYKIIFW